MLNNKTIAVVIPAYNEEQQILEVLKTIPQFVDKIIVVDDASKDKTSLSCLEFATHLQKKTNLKKKKIIISDSKYNSSEKILKKILRDEAKKFVKSKILNEKYSDYVLVVRHFKNGGVGAAIATGYNIAKNFQIDCTAVMNGDGQMDPAELESICHPIVFEGIDYVKGNRLSHRSAFFIIPKIRYFGNSILSLLTKIASGYWHVSDSQTGYTAISLKALQAIRLYNIYQNYGCPNDILVKLNIAFCSLKEVIIKPVYNVGEVSKLKPIKVIIPIAWLLFKSFFKRLYIKYLFRDFHPLFLLYHLAFVLLIFNIPFTYQTILSLHPDITLPLQNLLIFMFLTFSGLQSLFFAMWMDMQDNERLQYY